MENDELKEVEEEEEPEESSNAHLRGRCLYHTMINCNAQVGDYSCGRCGWYEAERVRRQNLIRTVGLKMGSDGLWKLAIRA